MPTNSVKALRVPLPSSREITEICPVVCFASLLAPLSSVPVGVSVVVEPQEHAETTKNTVSAPAARDLSPFFQFNCFMSLPHFLISVIFRFCTFLFVRLHFMLPM